MVAPHYRRKRLSNREKAEIIERIERHVALALQILEKPDPVTHLSIDGSFYFAFHSKRTQRRIADLRDEIRSKWTGSGSKYPLPWSYSQVPDLLQAVAGEGSSQLDDGSLIHEEPVCERWGE